MQNKKTLFIECPFEKRNKAISIAFNASENHLEQDGNFMEVVREKLSQLLLCKCGSGIFSINPHVQVMWSVPQKDRLALTFG